MERSSQVPSLVAKEALPLKGKRAVIFGAGGDLGLAVAREFASQGATLLLTSRTLKRIEPLADELREAGGDVETAQVDALDEKAVNTYLDEVAKEGNIDILLNVMGPHPKEYAHGTPILQLPLERFLVPLQELVKSQFITARSAARHMVEQRSGVILFVTAPPGRWANQPDSISIGAAFGAMESLLRSFAGGLGPSGVRVVGVRSGGAVDTESIKWSYENAAKLLGIPVEGVTKFVEQRTLLRSSPVAADTAKVAAFLASDAARTITGAIVNANAGMIVD